MKVLVNQNPNYLVKFDEIEILVNKIIASTIQNYNLENITLAEQFLVSLESISVKNFSKINLDFYRFILSSSSDANNLIKNCLNYINKLNNNIKFKSILLKYFLKNISFEEFIIICDSDLYEIKDLFQIIINNHRLDITNLSKILHQSELSKWINLLIQKEKSFLKIKYNNTSSLLTLFIASHLENQ